MLNWKHVATLTDINKSRVIFNKWFFGILTFISKCHCFIYCYLDAIGRSKTKSKTQLTQSYMSVSMLLFIINRCDTGNSNIIPTDVWVFAFGISHFKMFSFSAIAVSQLLTSIGLRLYKFCDNWIGSHFVRVENVKIISKWDFHLNLCWFFCKFMDLQRPNRINTLILVSYWRVFFFVF